jgi:myosin-5
METENTSNRVYISSQEFGWLPAKVIGTSAGTKVKVSVQDYADDDAIPVCEVSGKLAAGGGIRRKPASPKEIEVDMATYTDGGVLPLQNVDAQGRLKVVPDMVDLSFLHEAAILYNLKARHIDGIPYTRTGDIIIAVNPYQWIHSLYSHDTRSLYAQQLVFNGTTWIHID